MPYKLQEEKSALSALSVGGLPLRFIAPKSVHPVDAILLRLLWVPPNGVAVHVHDREIEEPNIIFSTGLCAFCEVGSSKRD